MPRINQTRSKYWVMTINNPDEYYKYREEVKSHLDLHFPGVVDYFIWQIERGENGTEHVQGYIEFSRVLRRNQVIHGFNRAHLELRRGSRDQARDYCRKEDTRVCGPFEIGTFHSESLSVKKEMNLIKEKIKNGIKDGLPAKDILRDVMENHFTLWCRYRNSITEFQSSLMAQRNFKTKLILCIGPTGTGKSRYCHDNYPDAYWKQRGDWWDNYDYNETVIVDDFYGWFKYDFLLRLTDRYPMQVPTKGSHQIFVAKTIIITSNQHPNLWYKNIPNLDAFYRRIDLYIFCPSLDVKNSMSITEARLMFQF